MRTLLVDNYDSYTYNLYQLIADLEDERPVVVRNDQFSWEELQRIGFDCVVLSPGPGRPDIPDDFGVCREIIDEADIPILGVCLGHQGIGVANGARLTSAPDIFHGRVDEIHHRGDDLFAGVPCPFAAVRYHSLIICELPPKLEKTAWTGDGTVMAVRHRSRPQWGLQFHPESICTEHGSRLLGNFLDRAREIRGSSVHGPLPDDAITGARPVSSTLPDEGAGRAADAVRDADADADAVREADAGQKADAVRDADADAARNAEKITRPRGRSHQLVFRKLNLTCETEAAFLTLFAAAPVSFWLDSEVAAASGAESGSAAPAGRFSYMGSRDPEEPLFRYNVQDRRVHVEMGGRLAVRRGTILDFLKSELAHRRLEPEPDLPFDFQCGFVGYFGYEMKADCRSSAVHRSHLPDAAFFLASRMIVFDHLEKQIYIVALKDGANPEIDSWFEEIEPVLRELALNPRPDPVPATAPLPTPTRARLKNTSTTSTATEASPHASPHAPTRFRLDRPHSVYLDDIRYCLEKIRAGESYEICLTNRLTSSVRPDPLEFYRNLRRLNPAPYAAFFRFGSIAMAGSSPERFLRLDHRRIVDSKPIKGTIRRGTTPGQDEALREELRSSPKSRAENLMIVDLIRNDLGQICEIGSVTVPRLMEVESFATVHQLVSTIEGRLPRSCDVTDLLGAAFPGGSMTGAPKLRTMQILDTLESHARGPYSGSLGFLSLTGAADLNIVIRTAVLTPEGMTIGSGGAIVAQSDPEEEFDEMMLKARALIEATVLTEHGRISPELFVIEDGHPGPSLDPGVRHSTPGSGT